MLAAWPLCLERLEAELPAEDFHTWVKPLQPALGDSGVVGLFAPNAFVVETIRDRYLARIVELLRHYSGEAGLQVRLEVGSPRKTEPLLPPV